MIEVDFGGTKKTLKFDMSLAVGIKRIIQRLSAVIRPGTILMSLCPSEK